MGPKAFHNLSLQVYIQLLYLYAFYGLVYSVLLIISKSSHALLNLLPCLDEALLWNALSPTFHLGKILFILQKPPILCSPLEGWSSISHYIISNSLFEGKYFLFSYKACYLSGIPLKIVLS